MHLKRFLFILIVFLVEPVTKLPGQQAYTDILNSQRDSIFIETFENNNNNWITDNTWISGKFIDGHFNIFCKNYKQNTGLTYIPIQIDLAKDFELETSFTIIKGTGALVFGLTKDFDHYRVEITDKQDLIIIKDTPSKNKVDKIFSGNEKSLIRDIGFYTKLTIRKFRNSYYVFANDIMIKQISNMIIAGNKIGFSVGLNSEISVDYLKVYYLNDKVVPLIAQRDIAKADSSKAISEKIAVYIPPDKEADLSVPVANEAIVSVPTAKDSVKAFSQNVVKFTPPISTTPQITWVSPSGLTTPLDTYSARIRLKINSASELKSALFYVNGASIGEGEIRPVTGENNSYSAERVVTLNPGENDVFMVATNSEGSSKSDLRYFSNPLASPPEINWGIPLSSNALVNSEVFTMEVCIKSPADLISAKVLVDGVQVTVGKVFQRSNASNCNYTWRPQIILKEGDNSIYVIAENIAGSTTSENRLIKFSKGITEKRLALVFGNADYVNGSSLKNPVNDANLMEATLKDLGFDVIKQLNSGKESMLNSIREFSKKLSGYNVALFYYAGHGIQVDGINYLIPTNAKLENKDDCKWEAVAVSTVTDELKKNSANTNIVILDACRNNPYRSWVRGGEEGFRAISPINGTIVSFSTSEGATAADGEGANGLFTQELVKQMIIPQQIESVFKRTRKEVVEQSNGMQTPTEWSYLTGDFYFKK